jgi:hypothetical protein
VIRRNFSETTLRCRPRRPDGIPVEVLGMARMHSLFQHRECFPENDKVVGAAAKRGACAVAGDMDRAWDGPRPHSLTDSLHL